jgi:hypothetical protein
MDVSNHQRSFVDRYLRFEPGGMVVDWDLLNGALRQYQTEGMPILDNRDVSRIRAQMIIANTESRVQDARVARFTDIRSLLQLEKIGVKFPLTDSDRAVGMMNTAGFERLMVKARSRGEESEKLVTTLGLLLRSDTYRRRTVGGVDTPRNRQFARPELERSMSNIGELGVPIMLVKLSEEELRYNSYETDRSKRLGHGEVEGRREARYRVARMKYEYERGILETLSRFRSEANGELNVEAGAGLEMLETRIQARVKNAQEYRDVALRIANKEIVRQGGPSCGEKPLAAPWYTIKELGQMAEYEKTQDDPALREYIQSSYRGGKISVYDSPPRKASLELDVPREGRIQRREAVVLAR